MISYCTSIFIRSWHTVIVFVNWIFIAMCFDTSTDQKMPLIFFIEDKSPLGIQFICVCCCIICSFISSVCFLFFDEFSKHQPLNQWMLLESLKENWCISQKYKHLETQAFFQTKTTKMLTITNKAIQFV